MEIEVPAPDATMQEIATFALRYDGYGHHGDVSALAAISRRVREQWQTESLPVDLDELRAALFFEQRRAHWNGAFDEPFVRALIEQIRSVSGGTVDGSAGITV